MMPENDPAVLEAKRRRQARNEKLVAQQEDAMLDRALRRRRKYWTWLALAPGLLGLLGYGGLYLVPMFSLPWVAVCPVRIILTFRHWTLPRKIAVVPGLYVLLLAGVAGVFFAAHVVAEIVEIICF